jgi:prepilin-type N-terminal cleavage/methylation domain-containing protein/prepilin-type processing-associated H-X9-DG protein
MRRAFTLIELLIVIGILGFLTALALPSAQRAREAARRSHCSSNLHQIGVALHSYEEQYSCYPILYGVDVFPRGGWRFKMFSAQSRLLPFLDQHVVFNAINFDLGMHSDANVYTGTANCTAGGSCVEVFLCPTDARQLPGPPADNNYRVNMGTQAEYARSRSGENGPFSMFYTRSSRDITDGLGQTAVFSEKLIGDGNNSVFAPDSDIVLIPSPFLGKTNGQYLRECEGLVVAAPLPSHDSQHGYTWLVSGSASTWYTHVLGPNSQFSDCASSDMQPYTGLFPARSWHLGGVNVLTADGAVRFLSEEVELTVWRALGTRSGAEVLEGTY